MGRALSVLPADLAAEVAGRNLLVFDGDCVLCAGFFQFIVKHDRAQIFAFATAQSPMGQALYAALDLPQDAFETNLVITDNTIHERMDAFAAVMVKLGGAWRVFGALRWLPRWLKDPLYHLIARNRFALFGRRDECLIPTPALRARFLSGEM